MRRLVPTAILAALFAAGCGEQRTRPPGVEHAAAPRCCFPFTFAGIGLRYQRPRNWTPIAPAPPLAGGLRSRTATVAVWRYPRTEPLPRGNDALEQARTLLLDRVRQRNPTFTLRSSEITRVGGARGIELTGSQTVAGFGYDVRSTHLFRYGAEIVIDAYAPSGDFERVDRQVFSPLLDSLEVTRP